MCGHSSVHEECARGKRQTLFAWMMLVKTSSPTGFCKGLINALSNIQLWTASPCSLSYPVLQDPCQLEFSASLWGRLTWTLYFNNLILLSGISQLFLFWTFHSSFQMLDMSTKPSVFHFLNLAFQHLYNSILKIHKYKIVSEHPRILQMGKMNWVEILLLLLNRILFDYLFLLVGVEGANFLNDLRT